MALAPICGSHGLWAAEGDLSLLKRLTNVGSNSDAAELGEWPAA
jgi:hypothetical protein